MTRILLVEDEVHKRDELTECLKAFFDPSLDLTEVDSVRSAFLAVSSNPFDLIILDMALPTFTTSGDAVERGYDQALGGLEVLRALRARGDSTRVIIITQHPEISIGGKRVKLAAAAPLLSRRYAQNVVGGILYKYKSPANQTRLTALLRSIA